MLFSASVVGRSFWRDVVEAVSDGEAVDDELDELERRDLVRREHSSRLEGDVEYRFRHALIRDVAYATIPRAERAGRHGDVARYIEASVGEDTGPVAWILAHHWRAAGEPARAVPHLLAAAAIAERGWATHEVVDLYSRALELAADDGMRATIRLRRGMALKALDADTDAAAELAAVLPELSGVERLDCLLYLGRAEIWCERHEEALRYGELALAFAEELGEPAGRAAALALVRNALAMRGDVGDVDRAIELGDEALALWPPGARGYERADHLHLQADVKYWAGDYRGCAALAVRAREAGGEVQSVHALLRGGGIDAMASVGLGEHEAGLAKLEAIMSIGRELGGVGAYLPNYQSVIFREVYDLDASRAANEIALEAARDLTFGMPKRFALSDLLQTDLLAGDVGRAQADWPALWEDAGEATGWTRWLILGRLAVARAEIALHAEPPEVAVEWATKAVEITVRTRRRKYEVLARTHLGSALVALRGPEDGLAELRAATSIADELVNPVGRWRSRAALADVLRETGDEAGAAVATNEACEIVTAFAATLAPAPRRVPARCASGPGAVRRRLIARSAAAMRPRGVTVAVERRRVRWEARRADRLGDRVRVVVDQHVRAHRDRVDPLGRRAHRDARHAMPVRLLLEPARVGRDDPRLRRGGREREVAHRLAQLDVRAERDAVRLEHRRGSRVGGEHDGLLDPREPLGDPAQALGPHVRLPVDGRDDVRAGRVGRWDAFARDGREAEGRVGHHVADHLDTPGGALVSQRRRRSLVRAEEERREPVDLDPRALLRHRQVPAPQARLDVRERDAGRHRGPGARERRVRVPEDEHDVRRLGREHRGDRRRQPVDVCRAEVEPMGRLVQPELVDEDLRQLVVPVLPRVHDDLVDRRLSERHGERRRLDELRAVADDGEHAHRARVDACPRRGPRRRRATRDMGKYASRGAAAKGRDGRSREPRWRRPTGSKG